MGGKGNARYHGSSHGVKLQPYLNASTHSTDRNLLSDSPYLKARLEVNLMARALD